jgi:dipeptidyl aminopeptidase/acylaminoacyl peptidase
MTALIPREILFGNPERAMPRLAPDGQRLAYLAPDEGVLNIWVRTVGENDDRPITKDRGRGIRAYFWAWNNDQILYIQDKDGDENWHVYAVSTHGGDAVDLTPIEGIQARIEARAPEFPDEVLVGLNNRVPQLHDVYRINLKTGAMSLELQNDIGAADWVVDHDFNVRLAYIAMPEGGAMLMHRMPDNTAWQQLLEWKQEDDLTTVPVAFAADNQTLYIKSSIGANTGELRTINVATGAEDVLASDPAADVGDILIHPLTHTVQAVAFAHERQRWVVLDSTIEHDFEVLAGLHHGDFAIESRDQADQTWIIAYSQDRGPTVYFTYDRVSKHGSFLFSTKPQLEELPLAEMKPVSIKTRDNLTIHGYLTLPVDAASTKLPVVVNVHGGPWARDQWGYNPEVQWLANRGYAVLQVNFRGSTGYGKDFINAGDREWGAKMQDDITDAVEWLIGEGIADRERIAIYGGSYGGYAVLSGLTTTPDLYACGVDIVGPSNLITLIKSIPPYWEPIKALFYKRVGDPEQDEPFLKSRSPLFHVDRIQAPLLIAQGANDPRVKREESLQMRDALEVAGKVVKYIEFPDEGHGFARPENRLKFYAIAEQFLAEHVGGRYEPA